MFQCLPLMFLLLTFTSLTHLEFIVAWHEGEVQLDFSAYNHPGSPTPFVKDFLPTIEWPRHPCQKPSLCMYMSLFLDSQFSIDHFLLKQALQCLTTVFVLKCQFSNLALFKHCFGCSKILVMPYKS